MASFTRNFSFKKPEQTDFYDVDDFNGNIDMIDLELARRPVKPESFSVGNLIEFDENGNMVDSGKNVDTVTGSADLESKVDKIPGMGLSSNDYTTPEKEKLAGLHNYDDSGLISLIRRLEDMLLSNITKNPFLIDFSDLDGLIVEGVWNKPMKRMEF